jgi:hypothetical protein
MNSACVRCKRHVYQKRGEQHLLVKSPPASSKSRVLMFIALERLDNQRLKQLPIVVTKKTDDDEV